MNTYQEHSTRFSRLFGFAAIITITACLMIDMIIVSAA